VGVAVGVGLAQEVGAGVALEVVPDAVDVVGVVLGIVVLDQRERAVQPPVVSMPAFQPPSEEQLLGARLRVWGCPAA
jgi:hypothetical protein